jgi:PKD repeat protein
MQGRATSGELVANFHATPTIGTVPLEVAFTDTSSGNIKTWIWVFGDEATSTVQHPTYTFTVPGIYTVSLMVIGSGGVDTATKFNYIVTEPPPIAAFSANPAAGDASLTVAFSDTSSGTVTSWAWDFGDGSSSTAQHPSHTYTTPGTYTVSLTVTGPAGTSTGTKSNYVSVTLPAPVAAFHASSTMGAAPLTVAFSDTSSGTVTSWRWDFGDGQSSTEQHPSHTYTAPGIYPVSLTVSGPGGSNTVTQQGLITVLTEVKAAQVRLNWSAPTVSVDDTPLNDLAGFKVYYGQTSGNYTGSINVGNVTSVALSAAAGFEVGRQYFMTVAALDTSGNEGPAAHEVSVTIPYAAPVASFNTGPTAATAISPPGASTSA